MLALAASLILTSSTGAFPETCRSCSLVAQLAQPEAQPAPVAAPVSPEVQAHRRELERQIEDLQHRIRDINVQWPGIATVMIFVGVGLVPSLLPYFLLTQSSIQLPAQFAWITQVVLAIGLTGAGLIVGGILVGVLFTTINKARRSSLIDERRALEDQLDKLAPAPPPAPAQVPPPPAPPPATTGGLASPGTWVAQWSF